MDEKVIGKENGRKLKDQGRGFVHIEVGKKSDMSREKNY